MKKKGANNTYFGSIKEAVNTTAKGASLTLKHLKDAIIKNKREATTADDENYFTQDDGIVTLNYPYEAIPVPDHGRYRLHNEMDDCIVCDKCAKVCPVDCIDIEPIKSSEVIGKTSDGTSKRLYAAKFDIDMAKCCFCGLCTTVCPTECLTMTKAYDFSEFDVESMNYHFANITPEEAEQKKLDFELAQKKKQEAALLAKKESTENTEVKPKVKFRPKVGAKKMGVEAQETDEIKPASKPVFRPKIKLKAKAKTSESKEDIEAKKDSDGIEGKEVKKPTFRPKIRAKIANKTKDNEKLGELSDKEVSEEVKPENSAKKPKFRPKIKAKIPKKAETDLEKTEQKAKLEKEEQSTENLSEKPVFKPKVRPKIKRPIIKKPTNNSDNEVDKE